MPLPQNRTSLLYTSPLFRRRGAIIALGAFLRARVVYVEFMRFKRALAAAHSPRCVNIIFAISVNENSTRCAITLILARPSSEFTVLTGRGRGSGRWTRSQLSACACAVPVRWCECSRLVSHARITGHPLSPPSSHTRSRREGRADYKGAIEACNGQRTSHCHRRCPLHSLALSAYRRSRRRVPLSAPLVNREYRES